jgi:hypothetical protein
MDLGIRSHRAWESHLPARSGGLDFHQVVPNLVLKIVGIVCQVRRAFEAFDDSDRDLAQFVKLRVFPRHSKTLIRLSCLGTESLWILRFVTYHSRLSALWLCNSWPDYSCMRSREICGFEHWSSHASLLVYFRLSVQAVRCCSYLAWPCKVFHS